MRFDPSPTPLHKQQLKEAAEAFLGLTLEEDAVDRLERFAKLLLQWNKRFSLTGASTIEEVLLDHALDSLSAIPFIGSGARIADLGSGAGFPGIPLAIVKLDAAFTLVEPRRKRANFLLAAVRALQLEHTSVIESRAEELPSLADLRFDLVVSRAFGRLAHFLRLALPLLNPGAAALAFKGPAVHSELGSLPSGFSAPELHWYVLPNKKQRCLVLCRRAESFT